MSGTSMAASWLFVLSAAAMLMAVASENLITGFDASQVYIAAGAGTYNTMRIWYRCPTVGSVSVLTIRADGQVPTSTPSSKVKLTADLTGNVLITGLAPGKEYFYIVKCRTAISSPGKFKTPPNKMTAAPVKFAWVGDIGGQGWGRNDELMAGPYKGGYLFAAAVADRKPDFILLQGDTIYADGPIPDSVPVDPAVVAAAGLPFSTYVNAYTKNFTAVTLDDFRMNWKYNLGDDKYRSMLSQHMVIITWDDHEVSNNWYPGKKLDDVRYGGMLADDLAQVARQALYEYSPLSEYSLLYNVQNYGKHLDVIMVDGRSYRGPNTANNITKPLEMLGPNQIAFLKRALKASKATWKLMAFSAPLSIIVGGELDWDSWASGTPEKTGREFELATILKFIKDNAITGVVFITSDVHYQAVINYSPAEAVVPEFTPFSEWVAGPCHAGAFGPNNNLALDTTFGPSYEYVRAPGTVFATSVPIPQNLPPPLVQAFGMAEVDAAGTLTMSLVDISGDTIFTKTYTPPVV